MRLIDPDESYDQLARSSQTFFTPIAVLKDSIGNYHTLTEVQIITGRTHQIRVVSADYLGHPVVGDRLYNPAPYGAPRQMLHALELTFQHPKSKEMMTIQAPVPRDFREVLSKLAWEY